MSKTSPYGLDPVTRRRVPFQWVTEDCRKAAACGCGFCKSYAACKYADCTDHATCAGVCGAHYGANGLSYHGRRVYPQYAGPAPAVGPVSAYRAAWATD